MEWSTFVQLPAATIATQLHTAGGACWAVAGGGTRRAYLAQGGRLAQPSVYPAYFRWLEATQRAVFDYLFDLGVTTVLATEHIPLNRGPMYQAHAREALALRHAPEARHHAPRDERDELEPGDERRIGCGHAPILRHAHRLYCRATRGNGSVTSR